MPRIHFRGFLPIILGAVGLVAAWYVGGGGRGCGCTFRSKSARARLDLDVIAQAVIIYAMQQSILRLPAPSDLPRALFEPGPQGEPPPFDADRLTDGRLLDPWGHPYEYARRSSTTFMLISYGRDGMPGGDGDDADISITRTIIRNR